MSSKPSILFAFTLLILLGTACRAQQTQPAPSPTRVPTLTPPAKLPASEAEVPRTTITETQAALQNGTAILLDVRSPQAFQMSHIAGALSIPLADIEANPAGPDLAKDKWIITYCT